MAIAGGMTQAWKCKMQEYQLTATQTTYPKADCTKVEPALAQLQAGETVIVAGSDIAQLRQRLDGLGVG